MKIIWLGDKQNGGMLPWTCYTRNFLVGKESCCYRRRSLCPRRNFDYKRTRIPSHSGAYYWSVNTILTDLVFCVPKCMRKNWKSRVHFVNLFNIAYLPKIILRLRISWSWRNSNSIGFWPYSMLECHRCVSNLVSGRKRSRPASCISGFYSRPLLLSLIFVLSALFISHSTVLCRADCVRLLGGEYISIIRQVWAQQ